MSDIRSIIDKLDFSDIDLTAPVRVVEEIMSRLSVESQGIIHGTIAKYDGPITSYTKAGWSALREALGTIDTTVDIQTTLGKSGDEDHKYELYLHTPSQQHYKFRILYLQYGIAHYPVKVVLEQGVANDIHIDADKEYIISCSNRTELESLIMSILNSKRIIQVMQELIRIHQVQKGNEALPTAASENICIDAHEPPQAE